MAFLEDFLKISTWNSLAYVLAIFIAIVIILLIKKYTKSWIKSMIVATGLGLIIALLFSALNNFEGVEHHHEGEESHISEWQEEVAFWGDILSKVFYNGTSIMLPFVLFASTVISILKYNSRTSSKNILRKGFGNVFLIFIIGIVITVCVSLLFFLIDFNTLFGQDTNIQQLEGVVPLGGRIVNFIPTSISDFFNITSIEGASVVEVHDHGGASVSGIISAVIAGGIFGLVLSKLLNKNKKSTALNQVERGIFGFYKVSNGILKIIIAYLPIAILGFVTTGIFEGGINQLAGGGAFIGFMTLTVVLIWCVLTPMNYYLTRGRNRKVALKKSLPTLITAFFTQSSQATLPMTRTVLKKNLGVTPFIADSIPTFAASGLSIACTGAMPLLSSLIIAKQLGGLDILFYIQAILIVTVLAFGMAGVPGDAAVASTNAVRSLFSNTSGALGLLGIILSTDLFSEMIRTSTNVYGAMTATLLTDWHYKRKLKKEQQRLKNSN